MKKQIVIKLLTSLVSSIILSILFAFTSFGDVIGSDDRISVILFGSIFFLIIFVFIGIPVSFLADLVLKKINLKSKVTKQLSFLFMYCIAGIIATVIFYLVSERELYNRLIDKEMIFFYTVGIISSITFYLIENLLKRIR
ncbi:hypothetical protein [Cohnella sp. WQ 127256]|uniref:hypothetical protein n=1 Tax=Cohnella sp. WQ 127256 TaxID=2938790 RepID=UPI00211926F8|nr:hypothetical protein [Cohnella sp. WQ 127256]